MADKGSDFTEERVVANVWVYERLNAGQTMAEVITVFGE